MSLKQTTKIVVVLSLLVGLVSCVEEFDFETQAGFENAIVVEATITNELKVQEIKLSRTFQLEESGPEAETNAIVRVTEGGSTTYIFEDMGDGFYRSTEAFSAQPDRDYQLNITTNNGQSYVSEITYLTAPTEIDSFVPTRQTNSNGVDGVALLIDSFDATGSSTYYKYEYEETYKIVSPIVTDSVFKLVDNEITILPKTEEETICYNTIKSNSIILSNTSGLNEDRISGFPVRFINKKNTIIANGYSVLVKQYTLSFEAYSFYETLRDFSGSGSIFSQTQPGFIKGNINATQNAAEKVIGFFNVSSVDTTRVFFNFSDVFPPTELPGNSALICLESRPRLDVLLLGIEMNTVRFKRTPGPGEPPAIGEGPYIVVPRVCVDCRAFGTLERPDFWED